MKLKALLVFSSGLVLLAFLSTIALAPVSKFREFRELVNADSVFMEQVDLWYEYPELDSLLRERAYRESLLKQAQSDSIYLVVNLSDSTVALHIKGVRIHQTRVQKFSKDKFLEKLPIEQEIKLLSQPLALRSHFSTIVKEPVVVRQAPRDTLEAALNAWQPDTLVQHPAYVSFVTEQGLRIIFEQDRKDYFRDHWKKFSFYSHLRAGKILKALADFVTFSRQEYQPTITIEMPVDDLRAVYRALPDSSQVVLKL